MYFISIVNVVLVSSRKLGKIFGFGTLTIDVAVALLPPPERLKKYFKRLCCQFSLALIGIKKIFNNKTDYYLKKM